MGPRSRGATFTTTRAALLAALLFLAACGGGGGNDPGDPDAPDVPADAGPDTPGDVPAEPLEITEDFRIAYGYVARQGQAVTDLLLRDPARPAAEGRASLSAALAALDPALGCAMGCRLDPTGKWLAVVVAPPESAATGSTLRLFRLRPGPVVEPSGLPDVTDVRALAFGDDALYWSRPRPACEAERGPSKGCHAFLRRPLSTPGPEEFLFTFPTAAALQTALPHSGTFRMGQDGRTVLLLAPTANSQSLWIWRTAGEPVRVAGPLCGTPDPAGDGTCIGSGVSYTDRDPVALSPNGNDLVFGLVLEDRRLVLGHLDLASGAPLRTAALLTMPSGSYTTNNAACYNRLKGWEPTAILAPLLFPPDGREVLFVGQADCGKQPRKAWTNVLAIPLERIDREGSLDREDLRWITDFPAEYSARSVTISAEALDLSPTGEHVVFVGTPRYDSQGQEIQAEQLAHVQDAEVWATRADGTAAPAQLTAELAYKATSVQAVSAP